MRTYEVELESITPIGFGRQYQFDVPKLPKESAADYEQRTWRNRVHTDDKGKIVITPLAVKNCLRDVARYLSVQIPGKGKSTYSKHFKAGVVVFDPITLPIKKDDVEGVWLSVPSDGMTGGSKRVPKCFPVIRQWKGKTKITVLDETITEDVLLQHLTEAGNFIGLGAMRAANGGIWGRFKVLSLKPVR